MSKFNVNNSSLESSVKGYHRKVVQPFIESVGKMQDLGSIMDKLITKDNIGQQSVKYSESTGSVEWSAIKNVPPDLTSSDPSFSTNHNHPNKETLDGLTSDSNGNVLYNGKPLITQEEYNVVEGLVDTISAQQSKCITTDNIGQQSVNHADTAGSVEWSSVKNTPSVYTPDTHAHTISDITDFPTELPASDVPAWAKSDAKPVYSWDEIQNKPTSYPSDLGHSHDNKTVLDGFSEDAEGNVLYKGNAIQSGGGDANSLINDTTASQTQTYSSQKIEERLTEVEASGSVNVSSAENNALETKEDGLYVSSETVTGKSAYETWLSLGNVGTEQEFINSLKVAGENGVSPTVSVSRTSEDDGVVISITDKDGTKSATAYDGADGKSAYQTWLDLGNEGTEEDFIESLRGEDGESAYEAWLALGNTGTKEDFINSLKGEGASGETSSGSSSSNVINMHQKIILDAVNGNTKYLSNDGNKIENVFVQAYKFVEGDTSVVEVLKSFDNTEEENFNFNSDNTEFNDTEGMKIQDTYVYSGLEEYTTGGLYITEPINLDEFKEIDTIKISK